MNGVNKVILIGHLGRDPETCTVHGDTVAEVSLATTESVKNRDGKREDRTEWHNLVLWGPRADFAGQYLKKGAMVYVEGKLQTQTWDKDGEKRFKTIIKVSQITALGKSENKPEISGDDEIPF